LITKRRNIFHYQIDRILSAQKDLLDFKLIISLHNIFRIANACLIYSLEQPLAPTLDIASSIL